MQIIDGQIVHDGKVLGSTDDIIVYRQEFPGAADVIRTTTPGNTDVIFTAADKLVGIECKLPDDLYTSIRARRLARQTRTLLDLYDVAVLMIRGEWPQRLTVPKMDPRRPGRVLRLRINGEWKTMTETIPLDAALDLWTELARLQALGVYVVRGPDALHLLPEWVAAFRPIFAGERTILYALAGTDQVTSTERRPGWLLRRIPSIGGVRSVKLHEQHGSTGAVFNALPHIKAPKQVIQNIEEALE